MVGWLSTPRFWIPGWRQALVFVVLVVLGLLAWGMGADPSGGAPFLGGSFEDRPFTYGFPFYLGTNLYILFAVLSGLLFPRRFYLWGTALLLTYPFAGVAHFLWLESVAGLDIVPDGAHGWPGVVFGSMAFAILLGSVATALCTFGAGLRLVAHRLRTGEW